MNASELQPGQILDDTYRIVRPIGVGGMGEVYEATHARLAGRYALKVLRKELSADPGLMARFRREAQITSSLRHPNIVQVVDFRTTPEGGSYIVMEYLDGVELAVEIGRVGPLPLERVRTLLDQIATGLAAAHEQGIVHRDLKPANLFLLVLPGSGRELVKIVDFGISKDWGAGTKLTQTATVMGTPQYMAPEQAMGQVDKIDARSDQFALATITYELIAGRCAFTGTTIPTLLYQLVHEEPPPIVLDGQPLHPSVDAVIRRGLSKEPANRFASVIDFARAFDAAVTESALGRSPMAPARAAAMAPARAVVSPTVPQGTPALAESPARPAVTTLGTSSGESSRRPPSSAGPNSNPEDTDVTPPKKNVKPVVLVASAAAAALVLVLGVLALRGRAPSEGGAAVVTAPAAEPPVGSLVGSSTVPAFPPLPGAGSPVGVGSAAAGVGTPASQVTISVEDAPPSLVVSVDGEPVGPPPIRLARNSGRHDLLFEAPGYRPYAKQLDSTQDLMLVLALKRRAGGGAGSRREPSARPAFEQPQNQPAAYEPPAAAPEKRQPGRFKKGVEKGVDSVSSFAKRHFGSSSNK